MRQAVSGYLQRWRGLDIDPARVVVTPGGKPVMFFAILALINPGDEVIYPDPGFPIYESMARFVGGRAVPMPLREERRFRFDPDEFRSLVTDRTRLIIINSPHNPTGSVLTHSDLEVIADVSRERNIPVLSDEIYARILYTGEHESIASFDGMLDRTIILDGWSKTWAMTGWRLGFGVFPAELMPHVERLISNSVSCTASFAQQAAIAALDGPQEAVGRMVDEFTVRRAAIVAGLNALPGVRCLEPDGAFTPSRTSPARGSRVTTWPIGCSRRPAWPVFRVRRSATMARGFSGSATPTASRTFTSPWTACAACWQNLHKLWRVCSRREARTWPPRTHTRRAPGGTHTQTMPISPLGGQERLRAAAAAAALRANSASRVASAPGAPRQPDAVSISD